MKWGFFCSLVCTFLHTCVCAHTYAHTHCPPTLQMLLTPLGMTEMNQLYMMFSFYDQHRVSSWDLSTLHTSRQKGVLWFTVWGEKALPSLCEHIGLFNEFKHGPLLLASGSILTLDLQPASTWGALGHRCCFTSLKKLHFFKLFHIFKNEFSKQRQSLDKRNCSVVLFFCPESLVSPNITRTWGTWTVSRGRSCWARRGVCLSSVTCLPRWRSTMLVRSCLHPAWPPPAPTPPPRLLPLQTSDRGVQCVSSCIWSQLRETKWTVYTVSCCFLCNSQNHCTVTVLRITSGIIFKCIYMTHVMILIILGNEIVFPCLC